MLGHTVRVTEIKVLEDPSSEQVYEAIYAKIGEAGSDARSWTILLGSVTKVVKPKETIDWLVKADSVSIYPTSHRG